MGFSTHRAQIPQKDPEKVSGALINVAKHVSSLKYHVWEKMAELVHYSKHSLDSVCEVWLCVKCNFATQFRIVVVECSINILTLWKNSV